MNGKKDELAAYSQTAAKKAKPCRPRVSLAKLRKTEERKGREKKIRSLTSKILAGKGIERSRGYN